MLCVALVILSITIVFVVRKGVSRENMYQTYINKKNTKIIKLLGDMRTLIRDPGSIGGTQVKAEYSLMFDTEDAMWAGIRKEKS